MNEITKRFKEAGDDVKKMLANEIKRSVDQDDCASDIAGMTSMKYYLTALNDLLIDMSEKIDIISERDMAQ